MRKYLCAGIALMLFLQLPDPLHARTFGKDTAVNTESYFSVVLQANDPAPEKELLLTTIHITGNGNSHDSYADLINKAKEEAQKYGANLIHIKQHKDHTPGKNFDEITASLYKANNPKIYEREFSWNKERKLSWDDFRGKVPEDAGGETAAATLCGFGFETNTISKDKPKLKVHVYNTFYTDGSWVKPEEMTDEVLQHEQGHFDLCELYTRKLREKLNSAQVNVNNLEKTFRSIYHEVEIEYRTAQNNYERETQHGVNLTEQKRWMEQLAKDLQETEQQS